ncbi:MAG: OsmC family protein [Gammaproteobacteria bacterium]|nr:OsmC family protein [Gammaproteobacteria bacterium]MDH5584368.1 OsmC family protein [Gammaproteobacteria bacterium]
MQDLPHHYQVSASAKTVDNVVLSSAGIPDLESAGPAEFGGPGDRWSPETLLVAAVADCFILSFRAVARASHFEWEALTCEVNGTLDKIERATQFTHFDIAATLTVAPGTDVDKATKLLEKAEHICLISNSLKAESHFKASIVVG